MINVVELLKNTANKYPKKTAVIEEDKKISYEELYRYTQRVGTYFCKQKLFNKPVIIYMNKGINTLIAFFGVALSGNYYSLINTDLPESRLSQIKDTIGANYVITDEEFLPLAKNYFKGLNILNIKDLLKENIDEKLLKEAEYKHIDYDPLYVNFTSGSTGVPKGVVISHRSVIDFINYFTEIFNFNEKDIIGNQAPFDFDVSVKDIYSAVKVGATLVIIPKKYFSSPAILLDYITDNKVSTLTWAVSALCLITTFHGLDYKVPTDVNKIIFSGEVMPLKHLKIWMEHLPKATFVNVYGPTEITCNCTYHIIDRNRDYQEKIPIGKAFPNERVILLDENDKEITEMNKAGEICVVGTSLGLGYFANSEQTEKHFIQNPLTKSYLENMYRTGDLGYYDENNDIIFNGRKDFQIKYMGHRVELEEIDKALMDQESIVRACCIFDEEKSKIYGFYIGQIDKKELHLRLKERLPIYMIPTKLIKLEEFPMTKNGKIDRQKLKDDFL